MPFSLVALFALMAIVFGIAKKRAFLLSVGILMLPLFMALIGLLLLFYGNQLDLIAEMAWFFIGLGVFVGLGIFSRIFFTVYLFFFVWTGFFVWVGITASIKHISSLFNASKNAPSINLLR